MTEQEKHVNHFLTLYIGECPHKDWDYKPRLVGRIWTDFWKCGTCKYETENIRFANPDFFAPNDFDRLRKWMEENEPELWESYLASCGNGLDCITSFNNILNPSNLFEFLVRERARWENIQDESRVVGYQHKAAVYLDSLEGK